MRSARSEKAEAFRELHHEDQILVLPNAWDVASARILERCGARAIGTTSMGVAATMGLRDGQHIELSEMLRATRSIAAAVDVPVTFDMEAGYGETTAEIVAAIRAALDCGAAGINIEDGTGDPERPLIPAELMADRVAAIRKMAIDAGVPIVVNARTDVFLRNVGPDHDRLTETIRRGNLYRAAGADCVFVPGGLERETITDLVSGLDAPLNVVANPAISVPVVPPVAELSDLGVARVSVGSGLMRATLAIAREIASELLVTGTYASMRAILSKPGAADAYQMAIGD